MPIPITLAIGFYNSLPGGEMRAFRVAGHSHHVDASAPATAGGVIFGILFLSVLLAVCRVWCRRAATARVVRIQSQHPSTSTQALIAPERIVTDGNLLISIY